MSDGASAPAGVRLAELVAVLSLGSDLGMGQPMEHAMRQCLIALRLGDVLGLDPGQRESLYYVSLIGWVGCHVDAYEQAKWFGDDLALKGDSLLCDMSGFTPAAFMAAHLGAGRTPFERMRTAAQFLAGGRRDAQAMIANHWYATDTLAGQLGLDEDTRATLAQTFERWDGKGSRGAAGATSCCSRRASSTSPTSWRSTTAWVARSTHWRWLASVRGRSSLRASWRPPRLTSTPCSRVSRR